MAAVVKLDCGVAVLEIVHLDVVPSAWLHMVVSDQAGERAAREGDRERWHGGRGGAGGRGAEVHCTAAEHDPSLHINEGVVVNRVPETQQPSTNSCCGAEKAMDRPGHGQARPWTGHGAARHGAAGVVVHPLI